MTENLSTSDGVTGLKNCHPVTLVETNVGSDSVAGTKKQALISETHTTTDSVAVIQALHENLTETNTTTDSVTEAAVIHEAMSETVTESDSCTGVRNSVCRPVGLIETNVGQDLLIGKKGAGLTEQLTAVDSVVAIARTRFVSITENLTLIDSVGFTAGRAVNLTENVSTSDSVLTSSSANRSPNIQETHTTVDSCTGLACRPRALIDTNVGSDVVTGFKSATGLANLTENLTASSAVSVQRAVIAGITPGAVLASDSFHRANQDPIANNWIAFPFDGSFAVSGQVFSNQYIGHAAQNGANLYDGGIGWPSAQFSQATLRTLNQGKGYAGLYVLGTSGGSNPGYQFLLDGVFNNQGIGVPTGVKIYNTSTVIASAIITPQSGDVFTFTSLPVQSGNLLTVFQNGTLILSVVDATIASGKPGILASPTGSGAVSTDVAWDNWSGGTFGMAELLTTTDAVSESAAIHVAMTESHTTNDNAAGSRNGQSKIAVMADTVTESDAVTAGAPRSKSLTEIVTESDLVTGVAGHFGSMTENLTLSDSILVTKCGAIQEFLATGDAVSARRTPLISLIETNTTTDAIGRSVSRSLTENLTTTSSLSAGKPGSFSVNISEAVAESDSVAIHRSLNGTLVETLTTTASVSISHVALIGLTENLSTSDILARQASHFALMTEQLTAQDQVAAQGPHATSIGLTENLTTTATVGAASLNIKALTETASTSDFISVRLGRAANFVENLNTVDSLSALRFGARFVTITENLLVQDTISVVAPHSVSFTETQVISDSITPSKNRRRFIVTESP